MVSYQNIKDYQSGRDFDIKDPSFFLVAFVLDKGLVSHQTFNQIGPNLIVCPWSRLLGIP